MDTQTSSQTPSRELYWFHYDAARRSGLDKATLQDIFQAFVKASTGTDDLQVATYVKDKWDELERDLSACIRDAHVTLRSPVDPVIFDPPPHGDKKYFPLQTMDGTKLWTRLNALDTIEYLVRTGREIDLASLIKCMKDKMYG